MHRKLYLFLVHNQDSDPYTKIFGDRHREWFFQTCFCKRPKELLALAWQPLMSLDMVELLEVSEVFNSVKRCSILQPAAGY